MRKLALAVLTVLLLGGCAGGQEDPAGSTAAESGDPGPASPAPGRPVLLVTIDTLRWDALGAYGSTTATPALDALASEGVRFDYAVAHAVVTLPSHASILTGLDPSRHGIHDNDGYRLGAETVTWAEHLRVAGYATGAFVGAFPVDSMFGLAQGFDVYDDSYEGEQGAFSLRMIERPAAEVVAAARGWLETVEGPWFAWVHVYDPHAPYEPPAEWARRYPDDPYAGEVAYVDATLAPLLAEARARDAIVVVTADHGEAFGDHGEETHGVFAYAATLRVPLILAGLPGAPPGTVVSAPARHVDLMPTVHAAIGLEPPAGVQGRSLYPAIAGRSSSEPFTSYFEALTPYLDWGWAPLRGLYSGDLKYVDLPVPELYAYSRDPAETENLAGDRRSDLRRLDGLLEQHLAAALPAADEVVEDPATLERLRALGYVGGAAGGGVDGNEVFGPADDPKRLIVEGSLMQDAVVAMESGRLAEAAGLLDRVIASRPDLSRAHRMLAAVRKLQTGPAAAADVLERAQAAGADSTVLRARLGQYQMEAGRLEDARRTIEGVLEVHPGDVEAISLLAGIYGDLGRIEEAEGLIERGLALDPTFARLHANRGTLMLHTDRLADAEQAFRRALTYDGSLADAHNGMGIVAARLHQDPAAAVEHWRRALEYAPDQPLVLSNLSVVLERLGRRNEAADTLERYLLLVPGDAAARARLERLR